MIEKNNLIDSKDSKDKIDLMDKIDKKLISRFCLLSPFCPFLN
jgi:hypothetical protein